MVEPVAQSTRTRSAQSVSGKRKIPSKSPSVDAPPPAAKKRATEKKGTKRTSSAAAASKKRRAAEGEDAEDEDDEENLDDVSMSDEEDAGEHDEEMNEEDEVQEIERPADTIKAVAQKARNEVVSHIPQPIKKTLSGVSDKLHEGAQSLQHSGQSLLDYARHAVEGDDDTKPAQRRSSRASTRASSIASQTLAEIRPNGRSRSRSRLPALTETSPSTEAHSVASASAPSSASGETLTRAGVKLHIDHPDTRHLQQYHPAGHILTSWRDVLQVAPHFLIMTALIVVTHAAIAAVSHKGFRSLLYSLLRPRSLVAFLLPRTEYETILSVVDQYLLLFPLLIGAFFVCNYFFRASVKSILLRRMDTSLRDIDYYSGALTATFSRFVFGVVHFIFIFVWWNFISHSENVEHLAILLPINAAFWAQDSLANAAFRHHSQTVVQTTWSYLFLWTSLIVMLVELPTHSFFHPSIAALAKPAVISGLIVGNFVQSLVGVTGFINSHSEFDSRVKPALWMFVFLVYVPFSVAFVLVPALASFSDLVYHSLSKHFSLTSWFHHHQHTKTPHQHGDPQHRGIGETHTGL